MCKKQGGHKDIQYPKSPKISTISKRISNNIERKKEKFSHFLKNRTLLKGKIQKKRAMPQEKKDAKRDAYPNIQNS
jgi:hypothetical protein